MTSCLLDLEQQAAELPFEQQRLLISFLQQQLDSGSCINMLEANFTIKPQCPHCHARHIKRHGKPNGRQRYRCHTSHACSTAFL